MRMSRLRHFRGQRLERVDRSSRAQSKTHEPGDQAQVPHDNRLHARVPVRGLLPFITHS